MARTARQKAAAARNLVKARAAKKRKGGAKSEAMRVRTHHTAGAVPVTLGWPRPGARRPVKKAAVAIHGKPTKLAGKFVTYREGIKVARAKAGLNQLTASRAHRALKGG